MEIFIYPAEWTGLVKARLLSRLLRNKMQWLGLAKFVLLVLLSNSSSHEALLPLEFKVIALYNLLYTKHKRTNMVRKFEVCGLRFRNGQFYSLLQSTEMILLLWHGILYYDEICRIKVIFHELEVGYYFIR